MALQSNGITVVEVDNMSRRIRFFVGSVRIQFQYQPRKRAFKELGRGYIDGRRVTDGIFIPRHQYRVMMRQAFAIATEHAWS